MLNAHTLYSIVDAAFKFTIVNLMMNHMTDLSLDFKIIDSLTGNI